LLIIFCYDACAIKDIAGRDAKHLYLCINKNINKQTSSWKRNTFTEKVSEDSDFLESSPIPTKRKKPSSLNSFDLSTSTSDLKSVSKTPPRVISKASVCILGGVYMKVK